MVIKRKNKIDEKEWQRVVNDNINIISLRELEHLSFDIYDYAILKIGGKSYGRLLWDWEKGRVDVEVKKKFQSEIYPVIESIALELKADFYIKSDEIFNAKKHLPIPAVEIKRAQQYFVNDELADIRWLAFREDDRMKVQKALKLKEEYEGMLSELLSSDDCGDHFVLTPSYCGWTFLLGDNIPYLLLKGTEQSSEEALTNLCKSLQKLSKKFGELQYYEHEEKSNITGYFKANNGKLIFGYWHSETEDFRKGRLPKEINNIHPASAHEVASIWSIDPLDFVFIKKMAKENSYMVVPI